METRSLSEIHARDLLVKFRALSPTETHVCTGPFSDHSGRLDAFNIMARRTYFGNSTPDGGVEVCARVNLPCWVGVGIGRGFHVTLERNWTDPTFVEALAGCMDAALEECSRLDHCNTVARLIMEVQMHPAWNGEEPDYETLTSVEAEVVKRNLALWIIQQRSLDQHTHGVLAGTC